MLDAILEAYVEDDVAARTSSSRTLPDPALVGASTLVDLAEYKRRQAPSGMRDPPRARSVATGGCRSPTPTGVSSRALADRHRPSRRLRLPSGTHARLLPARDRHGRGLHRARPVPTKDHQLVARHENDITETTDVALHLEFAALRCTKSVDDVARTGWFTEDLTLAERKTLHAIERIPDLRPANTEFDGLEEIPTLRRGSSTSPSAQASASAPRPSTRRTSKASASRSRNPSSPHWMPTASTAATRRYSSSPSRSATSSGSTA